MRRHTTFWNLRRMLCSLGCILAVCWLCIPLAYAKKPSVPGGGNTAAYSILQLETADGVGTHDHAYDVNDLREVVGRVRLPTGENSAAYWTVVETDEVTQSTLSLLEGGHTATAINRLGEIVGQSYDEAGAPIGVHWPSTSSLAIDLPLLPGFNVSLPHAINDSGLICGLLAIDGDLQSNIAVIWQVTSSHGSAVISNPIALPGGSSAQAVNNEDEWGVAQVVGLHRPTWTPLLWEVETLASGELLVPAVPQVLDGLGVGAFATGVSNNGAFCGRTELDAVVWSGGSVSILDRPGKGKSKVPRAWAWDIGDSGIIVGEAGSLIDPRACFWDGTNGSMVYLDAFLDADSPLLGLDHAEAVNAFDDIVGVGWNGAFIAIPNSP